MPSDLRILLVMTFTLFLGPRAVPTLCNRGWGRASGTPSKESQRKTPFIKAFFLSIGATVFFQEPVQRWTVACATAQQTPTILTCICRAPLFVVLQAFLGCKRGTPTNYLSGFAGWAWAENCRWARGSHSPKLLSNKCAKPGL